MPTRREELQELILDREMTPKDIARETQRRVTDVVDDLEHIKRSLGKRFEVIPAVCERCDFTFRKRDRLSPPSRCPRCRSERTAGPWVQARPN